MYPVVISTFTARHWKQHSDLLAIAAVLVAEGVDHVTLFQLDRDQDVSGRRHREQQVTDGHRWRRPEGEQESEIERMAHPLVEQRCAELGLRQLLAKQAARTPG